MSLLFVTSSPTHLVADLLCSQSAWPCKREEDLIALPTGHCYGEVNWPTASLNGHCTPPRIADRASPSLVEGWRQKAEVWVSICAVYRIISMMWSIPVGAIKYPLPKLPIIDSQGRVNVQSSLYNLADIASRMPELCQSLLLGKTSPGCI